MWKSSLIPALLFLAVTSSQGQYRNYSLRCLAPIVENMDPDAPETLQEAFLAGPKQFAEPLEGIGADAIEFEISTESPEAQALFDQGIALLHVLWYKEAERAFLTVVKLDPDCPMGYWGLAQANEKSPGRARIFAKAAKDRCDRNRPEIEQRWTELLARFYDDSAEESLSARSAARVRGLEEMSLDDPDHREIRAFLLRRLTLDPFTAGLSVTSALGIDTLAREFAKEIPNHPSRHYRTFLWLDRRPERTLDDALAVTAQSPQAAEVWRYAAENYRMAGQSPFAAQLTAKSILTDHKDLLSRKQMPWQAQNLFENYRALIDLLTGAGRIDEALEWAGRAIALPRSLENGGTGAEKLWADVRMNAGQWQELLDDLKSETSPLASDFIRDRADRLFWKGTALLALGKPADAKTVADSLEKLEREALIKGVSPFDEMAIAASRKNLAAVQKVFLSKEDADSRATLDDVSLSALTKARLYELAGRKGDAFRDLKTDFDRQPYRWLTTAHYCRLAMETGHQREALFPINRRFRSDASLADSGLPVLGDLAKLAEQLRLPDDWKLPATTPEGLEGGAKGADAAWQPFPAPPFALRDRLGSTWSLEKFQGRPLLLNFFLGVNCAFCLEQFDLFEPYFPGFEKSGIEVVAVSIDSPDYLREMLGSESEKTSDFRNRFPFPVLGDPELKVFRDYGVFDDFESGPMHATVLVGPDGTVLWKNAGHMPFAKPDQLLHEARRVLRLRGYRAPE